MKKSVFRKSGLIIATMLISSAANSENLGTKILPTGGGKMQMKLDSVTVPGVIRNVDPSVLATTIQFQLSCFGTNLRAVPNPVDPEGKIIADLTMKVPGEAAPQKVKVTFPGFAVLNNLNEQMKYLSINSIVELSKELKDPEAYKAFKAALEDLKYLAPDGKPRPTSTSEPVTDRWEAGRYGIRQGQYCSDINGGYRSAQWAKIDCEAKHSKGLDPTFSGEERVSRIESVVSTVKLYSFIINWQGVQSQTRNGDFCPATILSGGRWNPPAEASLASCYARRGIQSAAKRFVNLFEANRAELSNIYKSKAVTAEKGGLGVDATEAPAISAAGVSIYRFGNEVQLKLPLLGATVEKVTYRQDVIEELGQFYGRKGELSDAQGLNITHDTKGRVVKGTINGKEIIQEGANFIRIKNDFPGQEGFCGGYHSPLMLFFSDQFPQFTGEVNFELEPKKPAKLYWPEKGAPGYFLAYDPRGKGKIQDGSQLFRNSIEHRTGFEYLRRLDSNHDGVIDAKDPEFKHLVLWQDKNSNGKSEKGEVIPLSAKGVDAIDLNYSADGKTEFGNRAFVKGAARFKYREGGKEKTGLVYDLWFGTPI